MTEYDNNLSGALFKNLKKREGRQDPDYTGNCEIDHVGYWVSAWISTSKKDGSKFMSLRFNLKDGPPAKNAKDTASKETAKADFDDDIPFSEVAHVTTVKTCFKCNRLREEVPS